MIFFSAVSLSISPCLPLLAISFFLLFSAYLFSLALHHCFSLWLVSLVFFSKKCVSVSSSRLISPSSLISRCQSPPVFLSLIPHHRSRVCLISPRALSYLLHLFLSVSLSFSLLSSFQNPLFENYEKKEYADFFCENNVGKNPGICTPF